MDGQYRRIILIEALLSLGSEGAPNFRSFLNLPLFLLSGRTLVASLNGLIKDLHIALVHKLQDLLLRVVEVCLGLNRIE